LPVSNTLAYYEKFVNYSRKKFYRIDPQDTLSGRLDLNRFTISGSVNYFRSPKEAAGTFDAVDDASIKPSDIAYVHQGPML
jgi:hypothetical protein